MSHYLIKIQYGSCGIYMNTFVGAISDKIEI
jgi:hypothetical protein